MQDSVVVVVVVAGDGWDEAVGVTEGRPKLSLVGKDE